MCEKINEQLITDGAFNDSIFLALWLVFPTYQRCSDWSAVRSRDLLTANHLWASDRDNSGAVTSYLSRLTLIGWKASHVVIFLVSDWLNDRSVIIFITRATCSTLIGRPSSHVIIFLAADWLTERVALLSLDCAQRWLVLRKSRDRAADQSERRWWIR